jgi:hypothetical protein
VSLAPGSRFGSLDIVAPLGAGAAPSSGVVFNAIYNGTFNLESLSLDSAPAGSGPGPRELAGSATAAESRGRFSPDGRWIAYNSDESAVSRSTSVHLPTPAAGSPFP